MKANHLLACAVAVTSAVFMSACSDDRRPPGSDTTGVTASDINAAIIDQHVRDVSRRRCERDLEDPGCLLEGDIEELRRKLST